MIIYAVEVVGILITSLIAYLVLGGMPYMFTGGFGVFIIFILWIIIWIPIYLIIFFNNLSRKYFHNWEALWLGFALLGILPVVLLLFLEISFMGVLGGMN